VVAERAESLASEAEGCRVAGDAKHLLAQDDVDAVVIATTHDLLAPLTLSALEAGKHVLVEKPAALSREELAPVVAKAGETGLVVKVGFNHRFHPALAKAHELMEEGVLGPKMFLRARYGHGGRIGYDKEWRADRSKSGGGELIDQGMHLVDLSRWFLGELTVKAALTPTYFWGMDVEDNAFLLLQTPEGQAAWLHATWTEWKNMFSLEVSGRDAKLQVDGLGGSYGTETLTYYKMLPEMGPPEVTTWEFPEQDPSWARELQNFIDAIEGRGTVCGGLEDAMAALAIVADAYQQAP
jgi:predicted dehydrogenase